MAPTRLHLSTPSSAGGCGCCVPVLPQRYRVGKERVYRKAVERHHGKHLYVDTYDTYPPLDVYVAEFRCPSDARACEDELGDLGFNASPLVVGD